MYTTSASFMLHTGCNLACSYCFEGEKTHRKMSPEVARKGLDWLLSQRVSGPAESVDITFFGGEPLLNLETIQDLVEYAKEAGPKAGKKVLFNTTTNGTLFDEDVAAFWQENELGLLLSCDGTAEAHDTNRRYRSGKGSYDVLASKLGNIMTAGRSKQVRMTVGPDTVPFVADGVREMYDLGFDHVALYYVEEADWSPADLLAYEEQYLLAAGHYVDQRLAGRFCTLNPLNKDIARWLTHAAQPVDEEAQAGSDEDQCSGQCSGACASGGCSSSALGKAMCGAGQAYVTVDADGTLYPCHRFASAFNGEGAYPIGHIDTGYDEHARAPFTRMTQGHLYGCDIPCQQCDMRGKCGGSCIAANLAVTGHLMMRPPSGRYHEIIRQEVARAIADRLNMKTPEEWRAFEAGETAVGEALKEEV